MRGKMKTTLPNPVRILQDLQCFKKKGKCKNLKWKGDLICRSLSTVAVLAENDRTALTTGSQAVRWAESAQHDAAAFLSCAVLQKSLLKAAISVIYSQQMLAEQRNPLLPVCGHSRLSFAPNFFFCSLFFAWAYCSLFLCFEAVCI